MVFLTEEPKRPDPKGRLAVAAVMANEIRLATTQRAELVGLQRKCAGAYGDAKLIDANIAMIDKVLAAVAPNRAPAVATAPAATDWGRSVRLHRHWRPPQPFL